MSKSSYASSLVGDPGAGSAPEDDLRKGHSPSRYLRPRPEMNLRDCASCDLDLSLMGDVVGMRKLRERRGHAKCPIRAVVGIVGWLRRRREE